MGEEAKAGAAAAGPAPSDRATLGSKKRYRDADDLGRVAEIVLVLAGLGQMRGGRDPTALEKGLAAEARQKLVGLCESLRPLDLFSSDAARIVAGDLGFNPSKDPMGSRAPRRTSIAEKVLLTKKKMEESKTKESTVQSPQPSSTNLPGSFGIRPDNRGAYFHGQHRVYVDKPGQVSITAGAFASGSHVVHHVPMVSSGSPMKQTHLNDMQQTATPLKLTSNAAVDSPHFRLDMRSPPSTFVSQPVQANSSGNHSMDKTSTMSSVPSTSATANRPYQGTNLVDHISMKGDGACVISSLQTSSLAKVEQDLRPATQTALGHIAPQQLHDVNLLLPSSTLTTHNEIAMSVQKFLQPKVLDLPSWNPPSVDYMNKPLNCQVCKSSINDLESLLVCDACEKGVHLKCLKSYSHKTVSNVEWHCPKCLLSSNGKALPPKYGKVTRSNNAPKAPSNASVSHAYSEKRSEMTDLKSSQQGKASSVCPVSSYPSQSLIMVGRSAEPISERKMNARDDQCNNFSLVAAKEDVSYTAICPDQNNATLPHDANASTESVTNFNSSHSHVELSNVSSKALCQSENTSSAQGDNEINISFCEKDFNNGHQEIDKHTNVESMKHFILKETCGQNAEAECGRVITAKPDTTLTVDVSGTENNSNIPRTLYLHSVEWIGEPIHHLDDKTYYQTCRINGLVYNLQDHVLFTDGDRCYPSKLKVLWEDSKNELQFATVDRFYFPSDLPAVVIRPSTPEYDEVYASNDSCTVKAGGIHGPCVIVPPSKFKEESKKKSHIGDRNGVLCPVFLCRWFYDKSKALFQPMND